MPGIIDRTRPSGITLNHGLVSRGMEAPDWRMEMTWTKRIRYLDLYEHVSCNQHGDRYKKIGSRKVFVAVLTAKCVDVKDLQQLILLSHHLDTPVRYNFNATPQEAFVEILSNEQV